MKKFLSLVLAALLVLSCTAAFADGLKIAVPNDPTNEGRALLLLQANGYIKLDPNAGVTATKKDVVENPLNIDFYEVEAAMVPNVLADVDYAIINNNFALDFGLNPVSDSLLIESADSPYANVLCVNAGNETSDAAKALAAALYSKKVAAEILAEKNITLDIVEFSDYVQPNMVVDAGDLFANYFAHIPYQDNFNAENGTNIVVVAPIHVEPMGLYGGQQADLSALGNPPFAAAE